MDKAIDYIEKNYSHKITIEGIADYIGIDRKYLSSLFKDIQHTSPQHFLIKYRMDKACILITDELLSITHVAHSVGYDDPLLFSKMFKNTRGWHLLNTANGYWASCPDMVLISSFRNKHLI